MFTGFLNRTVVIKNHLHDRFQFAAQARPGVIVSFNTYGLISDYQFPRRVLHAGSHENFAPSSKCVRVAGARCRRPVWHWLRRHHPGSRPARRAGIWQQGGSRPGQTTRAEVIAKLGTNYVELPRAHAIAYTWEMRGGGGVWWVALAAGGAAGAIGGGWEGGWRGFFVAFDGNNVVRAADFKQLSMRRSLDENVDRWAAHLPKSAPANPPPLTRIGLAAGAGK